MTVAATSRTAAAAPPVAVAPLPPPRSCLGTQHAHRSPGARQRLQEVQRSRVGGEGSDERGGGGGLVPSGLGVRPSGKGAKEGAAVHREPFAAPISARSPAAAVAVSQQQQRRQGSSRESLSPLQYADEGT